MSLVIKNSELENLVSSLETKNSNLCSMIKDINELFTSLDDTKWNSNKKKEMDDIMKDFFSKTTELPLRYLNECTTLLRKSINAYNNLDNKAKEKIEKIDSEITVEII